MKLNEEKTMRIASIIEIGYTKGGLTYIQTNL